MCMHLQQCAHMDKIGIEPKCMHVSSVCVPLARSFPKTHMWAYQNTIKKKICKHVICKQNKNMIFERERRGSHVHRARKLTHPLISPRNPSRECSLHWICNLILLFVFLLIFFIVYNFFNCFQIGTNGG